MDDRLGRPNLIGRRDEAWRPPRFRPTTTRVDRLAAAARRVLDLQAGSIWNDLARLLPDCQGVVLDVGCGAQPYRSLVNPRATYLAIDDSEAERRFGYSMPDTLYYEGDRWPIADGAVDVVLCTETLEHVPNPARFLAEAARCLKPTGHIILTVPFAARWHFIPHDYWRFTPSGLDRLLTAAGFARVAVFARGNAVTVACYKVMALLLPFLIPQSRGIVTRTLFRVCGVLTIPPLLVLAAVAWLSLAGQGGADCLGYTALAVKSASGTASPDPLVG